MKKTIVLIMTIVIIGMIQSIPVSANISNPSSQFRGVWVSCFAGDMASYNEEETFKEEVKVMLDCLEYYNANALVFHVRTHNNALYDSALNPVASWWSEVDFNEFDPLTYLIDECHARGIEFHAWMNPYRISTATTDLATASVEGQYLGESVPSNNPASDPSNLIAGSGGVILNPGLPKVREFIVDTCMEVIEKYDVDAIHFDDYFYISGTEDSATRAIYNTSGMSIADWRREQVNLFIEALHKEMSAYNIAHNRYVQLGISPSGIYRNGDGNVTYNDDFSVITSGSATRGMEHYGNYLYSDTLKWCENNWIEYIIPQDYWAFDLPAAPFAEVIDWWNDCLKYTKVNLYAGIGLYKGMSTSYQYGWTTNPNELLDQLDYVNDLTIAKGSCIYKFSYMKEAFLGENNQALRYLKNLNTTSWQGHALLPEINNFEKVVLGSVSELTVLDGKITFKALDGAKFYAIYKMLDHDFKETEIVDIIGGSSEMITWIDPNYQESSLSNYGVKAISGTNTLGDATEEEITIYHKVVFMDNNGEVIKEEQIQDGFSATAPDAPVMENYVFKGWSEDFSKVTSDMIITANYEKSANPIVIGFVIAAVVILGSIVVIIKKNNHPKTEEDE